MNNITLSILLGLVALSAATKCYKCFGVFDGTCGDEYAGNPDHLTDCKTTFGETEDGSCYKYKSWSKITFIEITSVIRGCGDSGYNNDYCEKPNLDSGIAVGKSKEWTCSCTGDECNGGSQLAHSTTIVLAALTKYFF